MSTQLTPNATFVPSLSQVTSDLVLFAADTPNSWKPAAVLEELGVKYDVILIDLFKDEQKAADYVKMNPNGRTPTLLDRSMEPPVPVFESGAICMYLCEKFNAEKPMARQLLPQGPRERSEIMGWLFWQCSGLGPMMGQIMYMRRIAAPVSLDASKIHFSIERFHREAVRLLGVLEARLMDRDYLCGDGDRGSYTLADIACHGYASSMWWAGIEEGAFLHVSRWLKSLDARPAIQASVLVPGISNFGSEGPTFHTLRMDRDLQQKIEQHATSAGREDLFGWKDLIEIFKPDAGATPFASHVPASATQ